MFVISYQTALCRDLALNCVQPLLHVICIGYDDIFGHLLPLPCVFVFYLIFFPQAGLTFDTVRKFNHLFLVSSCVF